MTTQAQKLKNLMIATGVISAKESMQSKDVDADADTDADDIDHFDVTKYYVYDNTEMTIVAGRFDTMEDAMDAIETEDQQALPGIDFVDDSDDSEDDSDEAFIKGEWSIIPSQNESSPSKAVSFAGGKKHVKLMCGPGFKLVDGKCVKMTAQELMNRTKAAKLNAAKRVGKKNKKLAATMKKRTAAGL